jgi:hypothetical protein
MGFTIYATFYCDSREGSREHALELANWVQRNYVRLPGSESLNLVFPKENGKELPGPAVPRMQKVAWGFSKTMSSLNPFLSKALLLDRLRVASAYLGEAGAIRYNEDDSPEEIDPRTLVAWQCKRDILLTSLATPLWLVVWLFMVVLSRRS